MSMPTAQWKSSNYYYCRRRCERRHRHHHQSINLDLFLMAPWVSAFLSNGHSSRHCERSTVEKPISGRHCQTSGSWAAAGRSGWRWNTWCLMVDCSRFWVLQCSKPGMRWCFSFLEQPAGSCRKTHLPHRRVVDDKLRQIDRQLIEPDLESQWRHFLIDTFTDRQPVKWALKMGSRWMVWCDANNLGKGVLYPQQAVQVLVCDAV